jgi:hypothetical protein
MEAEMKRWLWMVFLCFCMGLVEAQERGSYVGFGVSYATFSGLVPNYPQPSLQVGGPISETLELRGTLESLLITGNLGLDILYPLALSAPDARLYAGGGVNTRLYFYYPDGFDLCGVVGGEYFPATEPEAEPIGVFAEVRVYLRGLPAGLPALEGRAGINLPL